MSKEQPSEATELYNAAYVWRTRCQYDLAQKAILDGATFEEIEYCFDRYKSSVERELRFEGLRKAQQATKQ